MLDLAPCSTCKRHVAITAVACPFCTAPSGGRDAQREPSAVRTRAAIFAASVALAGCGPGKHASTARDEGDRDQEERHSQNHPCSEPDPKRIEQLQKELADAPTDEEKTRVREELERAQQPVCAPYGAPPARRRIV